jgi:hypothetical protein
MPLPDERKNTNVLSADRRFRYIVDHHVGSEVLMNRLLVLFSAMAVAVVGLADPAVADPAVLASERIPAGVVTDLSVAANTRMIQVRHSNKCLDVEQASTADRANVEQYTCRGTLNQLWDFIPVGMIYYEIRAAHSNKCLDVEGPSTADRANIHQFTCRGTTNQHFYLTSPAPGWYAIHARHSGKCVDVEGPSTANGANVHQFTCRNTTNQQWRWVFPT